MLTIEPGREKGPRDQAFSNYLARWCGPLNDETPRCFTCNIPPRCFTCNILRHPVTTVRPWSPSARLVADSGLRERGIHPSDVMPGCLKRKDER